jgi:hypothetical protein
MLSQCSGRLRSANIWFQAADLLILKLLQPAPHRFPLPPRTRLQKSSLKIWRRQLKKPDASRAVIIAETIGHLTAKCLCPDQG